MGDFDGLKAVITTEMMQMIIAYSFDKAKQKPVTFNLLPPKISSKMGRSVRLARTSIAGMFSWSESFIDAKHS